MKTEKDLKKEYLEWLTDSNEDILTASAKYRSWKAAYLYYVGKIKNEEKTIVKSLKFDIIDVNKEKK